MKSNYHYSVMLNESIDGLNIKENGIYVDCTLGRGGHASKILSKLKTGLLIGIDQDQEAIDYSKELLSSISSNYKVVKNNFRNIDKILEELNINKIDGAIYDLGVSSPQFDEDYRGFSYKFDSELDMRMDQNNPLTAKYIVNNYSLNDLVRIFTEYGEEKYSYSIAKNIVEQRKIKEISTTFDLVEIIKKSKPTKELNKKGHPAKQIFQALRIEVNDELNALEDSLNKILKLLNVGGRLVVISFHSLEDRIVKNIFKENSVVEGNRINEIIDPKNIKQANYRSINKKVIIPSDKELEENSRSKSAKLRILERLR